jgi:hypothetical protein
VSQTAAVAASNPEPGSGTSHKLDRVIEKFGVVGWIWTAIFRIGSAPDGFSRGTTVVSTLLGIEVAPPTRLKCEVSHCDNRCCGASRFCFDHQSEFKVVIKRRDE